MMKRLIFILFVLGFLPCTLYAQLVDKTPAPIPNVPVVYNTEPWENPLVDGINRDPARATAYSYRSIKDALAGDREKSGRMMSLNGYWDFSYAVKPGDAP